MHRETHYKRIRFRARWLSGVAAVFVPIAISVWLIFRLIVCGGPATPNLNRLWWENRLCAHAHILPDLSLLAVLLMVLVLLLAMSAFAEECLEEHRDPNEPRLARYRRQTALAYGKLDEKHRSIVYFASEMAVWGVAALIFTLVFYESGYAFPLGLLAIAAIVVTVFRLIRRAFLQFFSQGRPRSTEAPTKLAT